MSRDSILQAVKGALSPRPTAPALPAFLDPPEFPDLVEAFLTALRAAGGTGEISDDPARVAGALEADFGIAETGTVVEVSGTSRSRLASLLPEAHLVVLPVGRLRASLGGVLSEVEAAGIPGAAVTLITGPSRTADIEQVLTIGVHGPKRVHVILWKGGELR